LEEIDLNANTLKIDGADVPAHKIDKIDKIAGYRTYCIRCSRTESLVWNNQALHDINMKIRKNEITAIIGPSGCGNQLSSRRLTG
jgi:ABC-type glutathione transport system ATPase component